VEEEKGEPFTRANNAVHASSEGDRKTTLAADWGGGPKSGGRMDSTEGETSLVIFKLVTEASESQPGLMRNQGRKDKPGDQDKKKNSYPREEGIPFCNIAGHKRPRGFKNVRPYSKNGQRVGLAAKREGALTKKRATRKGEEVAKDYLKGGRSN